MFSDCPETGEPRICSARIRTYLLERSRVIFQPQNERNFHIFYQLCAGAPAAEREELGLKPWEHFHYLNQGNAGVVEEMNDELMFMETTKALSSAKISFTTQWNIFRVCAGILHIGNIKIKQVRDKVTIDDSDEALLTAVKLLGIDAKEFKKWILNKTIKMRSEKIVKPLDLSQAIVVRDSVAKYLYSSLFSWLVAEIGTNLEKNKSPSSTPKNFIGVLDIYGFEHFEENSFEQFCINYANEKLQQEFNSHVFKLEQEEYFNEKIKWSFITFTDNQECIDLIEGKNGVFDMLNEESRLTMGTDKSLLIKLNDRFLGKNNFYLSPRFGQDSFTVKHYACDVTYKINGFIEKNKDTVPDEQHQLLLSTAFGFLREVLSLKTQDVTAKSSSTDAMASENKTLGSIFKSSLVSLMDTICQTEVHYIRCIKPNYECHPFKFDPKMVLQQLRACGVLETIKISCKGYPTRATYDDFVDRYYMLVQSSLRNEDSKEFTIAIVNSVLDDADKFQMGLTKVFFRAGQLAYLEKLRNERQIEAAILIQRNALRHLHRKRFIRMMEAALKIQCAFRRHLAIKISSDLRHTRAATIIQKYYRRHLAVRRLAQFKKLIVSAQIIYRYIDSLDIRKTLQYCNACTIIQKSWRAALQRRKFAKVVSHVILVQSRLRTLIILMQVPQLLAEARSVGKLKETNHRLENKIIELSRKLEESKIQEEKYLQDISHCTITIEKWKVKYSKLESKYSDLENKMLSLKNDLESRIDGLSEDILIHKSNNTELERLLEEKNLIISKYESKFKGGYNGYPVRSNRSIYSLTGMMSSRSYGKMDKSVQRDRIGLGDDLSVTSAQQHDLHRSMSHAHAQGLTGYQMVDHNDDNSGILTHMHDDREYRSHIIEPHSRILGTSSPFDIDYRGYRDILDCLKDPHLPTEVRRCLITNLRVPHVDDPDKTRTGDWHILYCANIIGNIALQLLNHDCYSEYGSLMHAIIEALGLKSKEIESYDDYSFWVSNTFTLIRIIYTIFRGPAVRESLEDGIDKCLNIPEEFSSYTRELENLLITILNNWINKIKSDIRHMIISAVIESQPLPGYAMPEKKRSNLLHTFIRARKQPDSKIDDITSFLNDLLFSMKAYVVDDSIQYQIILEVYTYINCVALNDLLSRENFWTWMRGLQLSYNVSSLQEWCKKNDKFHGIQQTLINIYQASKLISMNKGIANVAETISDVCFSLSRTQVSRIVSIYVISAGESKVCSSAIFNLYLRLFFTLSPFPGFSGVSKDDCRWQRIS